MKRITLVANEGFSLVELMVAMTITLLIMSGVLTLFRQGILTSGMTTQQTEMQQNREAGQG